MRFNPWASKGEVESERRRFTLPTPSPQFRRRAWREFQRALDPLAPPRPLRARFGKTHASIGSRWAVQDKDAASRS